MFTCGIIPKALFCAQFPVENSTCSNLCESHPKNLIAVDCYTKGPQDLLGFSTSLGGLLSIVGHSWGPFIRCGDRLMNGAFSEGKRDATCTARQGRGNRKWTAAQKSRRPCLWCQPRPRKKKKTEWIPSKLQRGQARNPFSGKPQKNFNERLSIRFKSAAA